MSLLAVLGTGQFSLSPSATTVSSADRMRSLASLWAVSARGSLTSDMALAQGSLTSGTQAPQPRTPPGGHPAY